jgi:hypothetical protein
VDEELLGDVN